MAAGSDYKNDSGYRRYSSTIEKNLQTFESINEWADVISFLTRLSRTISSFPKYNAIPKRLLVGKRLAQCLNPALPGGVHQKTLEVYDIIFRKIGAEGLCRDLPIYSVGLFPFFEHASTASKDAVISLVEKYLLPLGSDLLPSLQGLVLALLTGLEEDTSEHFVNVFRTISEVRKAVGSSERFYESIWTALLVSVRHRQAVVNYITREFPAKLARQEDQQEMCAHRLELVSTALSAALEDKAPLVVRGLLDIMLIHFGSQGSLFDSEHQQRIVKSMLLILLRKEMSLNRRLFSWLQGEDGNMSEATLSHVIAALKMRKDEYKDLNQLATTFRLFRFMMDKPGLFQKAINSVLLDYMLLVEHICREQPENAEKVISCANLYYEVANLSDCWTVLCRAVLEQLPNATSACDTSLAIALHHAVSNLSICDEEASGFVGAFLLAVCVRLHTIQKLDDFKQFIVQISEILELGLTALGKIKKPASDVDFVESLGLGKALDETSDVLKQSLELTILFSIDLVENVIAAGTLLTTHTENVLQAVSKGCGLISELMEREIVLPSTNIFSRWIECMQTRITSIHDIKILSVLLDHLLFLSDREALSLCQPVTPAFVKSIFAILWQTIFPSRSLSAGDKAAVVSKLCRMSVDEVDNFLSKVLSDESVSDRIKSISQFSEIWDNLSLDAAFPADRLSKTIFALIDTMNEAAPVLRHLARNWFVNSIGHADKILDPLLALLLDSMDGIEEVHLIGLVYKRHFNLAQVDYAFRHLLSIFDFGLDKIDVFVRDHQAEAAFFEKLPVPKWRNQSDHSYALLILLTSLPYALAEPTDIYNPQACRQIEALQSAAQQLIQVLISNIHGQAFDAIDLVHSLLMSKLEFFIGKDEHLKASQLLRLLEATFIKGGSGKTTFESAPIISAALTVFSRARSYVVIRIWCEFFCSICTALPDPIAVIDPLLQSLLKNAREIAFMLSNSDECDRQVPSEQYLCAVLRAVEHLAIVAVEIFQNMRAGTERNTFHATLVLELSQILKSFSSLYTALKEQEKVQISWSTNGQLSMQIIETLYRMNPNGCLLALIEVLADSKDLSPFIFDLVGGPLRHNFVANYGAMYKMLKDAPLQRVDGRPSALDGTVQMLSLVLYHHGYSSAASYGELWTMTTGIIKDALGHPSKYRSSFHHLARACIVFLSRSGTEWKLSREHQDLFHRLCDSCIAMAARLYYEESATMANIPADQNALARVLQDSKDKANANAFITIWEYLVPNWTKILEPDRLQNMSSTLVASLILPSLKGPALRKSGVGLVAAQGLSNICAFANLVRAWKKDYWETFFDNQFFEMNSTLIQLNIAIMKALIQHDPEKMVELVSKVPVFGGSTAIFQSKEIENTNRSLMTRRLAFVVYCSEPELIRQNLTILQEKIVELMKLPLSISAADVYLLVRVLLHRLSEDDLAGLWPIVLTDLMQLLKHVSKTKTMSLAKELLLPLLQACKLLEQMLIRPSGSILIYSWIFVCRKENIGEHPRFLPFLDAIIARIDPALLSATPSIVQALEERRPLITFRTISSIEELYPFFASAPMRLDSHNIVNNTPNILALEKTILDDFSV